MTLNKTLSFTDMGANKDLISCFSHLGLIKDDEEFPPKPFFIHPIAEAMAQQVYNPDNSMSPLCTIIIMIMFFDERPNLCGCW